MLSLATNNISDYNVSMKNDEFDKLFKYMAKRFDALEKKVNDCADKESLERLTALENATA